MFFKKELNCFDTDSTLFSNMKNLILKVVLSFLIRA